jgi:hypothetical protein
MRLHAHYYVPGSSFRTLGIPVRRLGYEARPRYLKTAKAKSQHRHGSASFVCIVHITQHEGDKLYFQW